MRQLSVVSAVRVTYRVTIGQKGQAAHLESVVTIPRGQYRRFNSIDVIYSMGAPDIFFSYAREDEARVAAVVAALEARGWSVFWDRRIPAGQTWRSHIGRALEQARCVVVAWSEHSIQSDFVIEEADEVKRRNILVPVLLDRSSAAGFGEFTQPISRAGRPSAARPRSTASSPIRRGTRRTAASRLHYRPLLKPPRPSKPWQQRRA